MPDLELAEKPPARKRTPKAVSIAKEGPSAEEGEGEAAEQVAAAVAEETDGAEAAPPKKKTRRGSRGGRNRKKPAAAWADNGAEPAAGVVSDNGAEAASDEYVPMSEWLDDLDAK